MKIQYYFSSGLLLLTMGVASALAQTNPVPSCAAQVANPPLMRSQSATEMIGDIVISCTGGTPTPAGSPIPTYMITVTLNTTITSRVFNHNFSEALLIIDDASPSKPNPSDWPESSNGGHSQNVCAAYSMSACEIVATGHPSGTTGGDYDGANGHYNVFEGVVSGINSISFIGIPVDAPGPSGRLTMRITNIRTDASQVAAGSAIQAFLGTELVVNNSVIAGYAVSGLTVTPTPASPISGTSSSTLSIAFLEGFANSFKPWMYLENGRPQNVPGFSYYSESGLWDTLAPPAGMPEFGLANHGTRLMIHFSGYPAGIIIIAPSAENLLDQAGSTTGSAVYVATDANGNSTGGPAVWPSKFVEAITDSQGNAWLTYEVVQCDPNTPEGLLVPIIVESQSVGTVTGSFAPLVSTGTAPIPRFVER